MWGDLLAVRSRFGLDRFPADRTIEDHNRHKPQHFGLFPVTRYVFFDEIEAIASG